MQDSAQAAVKILEKGNLSAQNRETSYRYPAVDAFGANLDAAHPRLRLVAASVCEVDEAAGEQDVGYEIEDRLSAQS